MTRSIERQGSLNSYFRKLQTEASTAVDEPTTLDDWQTSEVSFTTVRRLDSTNVPPPGRTVTLLGGAALAGHPDLNARARLSTESLASRDLDSINLPRLVVEDPGVCVPFTLVDVPTSDSILERLLAGLITSTAPRRAAASFFLDKQNDMAVSTDSMRRIASHNPRCVVRIVACDHLSYFRNPESLKALAAVLESGIG
jgi:hypothetical protein